MKNSLGKDKESYEGDILEVSSGDQVTSYSIKNATSFIPLARINQSEETNANLTVDPEIIGQLSNSSYYEELLGFAKKVVTKVKGGFNKVKTKVNDGIGKIKSKISQVKNNIGGGTGTKNKVGGGTGTKNNNGGGTGYKNDFGGGGTGSHYYRRPYNRNSSSGGGSTDPTVLWVLLGLGIAGVLGTMLYFMIKQ